jgi:hypothetical protein
MDWKDAFNIGKEAILVTSSKKGKPHAIYVICKGIIDNNILLSVCQMNVSLANIRENPLLCLITKNKDEYYRINGRGTLHSSGKYFDLSVERNVKGTPVPNYALIVNIKEVHDVDAVKRIL